MFLGIYYNAGYLYLRLIARSAKMVSNFRRLNPPSLFSHSLLSSQPSSQLLLLLILPFPAFSFPRSLLRTLGFKQLGRRGDDTCGAVRVHGRCWLDYWLGLRLGSGSSSCSGGFGSETGVIFQDPLVHVLKPSCHLLASLFYILKEW